jgi:hypothetical protein
MSALGPRRIFANIAARGVFYYQTAVVLSQTWGRKAWTRFNDTQGRSF